MWTLSVPFIFWATIIVQLLSLGSIVAIGVCASCKRRTICHRLFFASLLALGLITVLAVGSDSNAWMGSGASLSVMTVCATFDFRGTYQNSISF